MALKGLDTWYAFMKTHDAAALWDLLHPDAVLEFENVIDGIKINGVDIITFADDGRITHFKVMVRPLKAINLLHRLMGEQLAQQ